MPMHLLLIYPLRDWQVDDLVDISKIEDCIAASQIVLIFLSGSLDLCGNPVSDYMRSANCSLKGPLS